MSEQPSAAENFNNAAEIAAKVRQALEAGDYHIRKDDVFAYLEHLANGLAAIAYRLEPAPQAIVCDATLTPEQVTAIKDAWRNHRPLPFGARLVPR